MTDYAILDHPGIASVEADAVGEAVSEWLTGRGWTGTAVSFCIGYARAKVRAAHQGGRCFTTLMEMVLETENGLDQLISPADQQHLKAHIDDVLAEVSASAIDQHRRLIAKLARAAAGELVSEEVPEAGVAAIIWAGVTAQSMVLGVGQCSVAIGDPVAAAARREIAWRQAHEGRWSESDYWVWLAQEGQQRELARRIETMLLVEGIGAGE